MPLCAGLDLAYHGNAKDGGKKHQKKWGKYGKTHQKWEKILVFTVFCDEGKKKGLGKNHKKNGKSMGQYFSRSENEI